MASQNKNHSISIYEKTVSHKNSGKVPFGRQKGPLQISKRHCIKIVKPSCRKSTIYVSPPKWLITQIAIARYVYMLLHIYANYMAQNSKIWGGQKNLTTF